MCVHIFMCVFLVHVIILMAIRLEMTDWHDTAQGVQSLTSHQQIWWHLYNIQFTEMIVYWPILKHSLRTDDQRAQPNCVKWNPGWRVHVMETLQFWKWVFNRIVFMSQCCILLYFLFQIYRSRDIISMCGSRRPVCTDWMSPPCVILVGESTW